MSLVVDEVPVKWLALQQVGLDEHRPALPLWLKMFLRWVYFHYGWAAIEGIQFLGCFDTEAEARHRANCPGGSYRSIPCNATLEPSIAVQFGIYDHPQSEASADYRNRQLPFVTLPRAEFEALGQQIHQVLEHARDPIAI